MALYNSVEENLRPGVVDELGKSLQPYQTADEAIGAINRFLGEDKNEYIIDVGSLKQTNSSVCELFVYEILTPTCSFSTKIFKRV